MALSASEKKALAKYVDRDELAARIAQRQAEEDAFRKAYGVEDAGKLLTGTAPFADTGRESSGPGEKMDAAFGAPLRTLLDDAAQNDAFSKEGLLKAAQAFGKDPRGAPTGYDIASHMGIENPYLGAAVATGADLAQLPGAGLLGKAGGGVAGKIAPEVEGLLSKIDTPEKAVALKGAEREAYLKALDDAYGPREQRARDMGFGSKTWYHGSSVDIPEFRNEAKGLSTGAQSAKRGFFFAEDPSTASDYADLAREKGVSQGTIEEARARAEKDAFMQQMQGKYGKRVLAFGGEEEKPNWQNSMNEAEAKRFQELEDAHNRASDAAFPDTEKLGYSDYGDKRHAWWALKDSANREAARQKSLQDWQAAKESGADWLVNGAKGSGLSVDDFIKEKTARLQNPIPLASPEQISSAEQAYYQSLKDFAKTNEPSYAAKILGTDLERAKGPERQAILDALKYGRDFNSSGGQNVLPVRLRGRPMVKDYGGTGYRDTTYAEEMAKAQEMGRDGVLFQRTYDPADPNNRVQQNIAAVFEPNQVRSVNAAFDPRFKDSPLLLAGQAGVGPAPVNLNAANAPQGQKDMGKLTPQEQQELAQLEKEVGPLASQTQRVSPNLTPQEQQELQQLEGEVGHLAPPEKQNTGGLLGAANRMAGKAAELGAKSHNPFMAAENLLLNNEYGKRALGYAGGLVRTGLAALGGAADTDDMAAALKGKAPRTADYLERSGYGPGPSVPIPAGEALIGKGDISARDAAGFLGDVATDPLAMYAAKTGGPFSSAAESTGAQTYKSALKRLDQVAERYGKEPVSDLLMKEGITGDARTIYDKMDQLGGRLKAERDQILRDATRKGAEVDMQKAMAPAQGTLADIERTGDPTKAGLLPHFRGTIDDYLSKAAQEPQDILRELPYTAERTKFSPMAEQPYYDAPTVSAPGHPGASESTSFSTQDLLRRGPEADARFKRLPNENVLRDDADTIGSLPVSGKYEKVLEPRTATVLDQSERVPGPSPIDVTKWKSTGYARAGDAAYKDAIFSPEGKQFQKSVNYGLKTAVEDAVGKVLGDKMREALASKNKDLGRILTTEDRALLDAEQEARKNAFTSVDGMLVTHPGILAAKKAADISKSAAFRTNLGKGLMDVADTGVLDLGGVGGLIRGEGESKSAKKKRTLERNPIIGSSD